MTAIVLHDGLSWRQVAHIACGGALELSPGAQARIARGAAIISAIVAGDIRAYGVNTGVGALSDTRIPSAHMKDLSRSILMSHATGMGPLLGVEEARAIMAATVANFAHGHSGVRPVVVQRIVDLLNAGCTPDIPRQGSVGYLSHKAYLGLALVGQRSVVLGGERMPAADALARLGFAPLVLEAKEGLALVNGTGCAAGLGCLAVHRAVRLLDWAVAVSAMTFETQRCQLAAIAPAAMALRTSAGVAQATATLNVLLAESGILSASEGRRTQDALSLRSLPQLHGAALDALARIAEVTDEELASFTDNPAVAGSPDSPQVLSQAHAVGAAIGLAMDHMGVVMAQAGMCAERRLDRMVNPLVSGLAPFLAAGAGVESGFMVAQYAATSLVAENRRLAQPASLDGGVTSGLQEDLLCHATPAALKALEIIANVQTILSIELLAACQSYDLLDQGRTAARRTMRLYRALRQRVSSYDDSRPLCDDIRAATAFIQAKTPGELLALDGLDRAA